VIRVTDSALDTAVNWLWKSLPAMARDWFFLDKHSKKGLILDK